MSRDEIQRSLFGRVGRQNRSREAPEQKAIMEYFNFCVRDCHVWRRNVGGRDYIGKDGKKHVVFFGEKGQADVWGVLRSVHLECEVKAPGEEPRPDQLDWLEDMRRLGAIALWADSLEMLKEKLQVEFARRGWK